ncbi:hypothetical protein E2562_031934 [Oryza meyeriana var. granulata]|uniref:Uncharacterized protein n=1 Tax=Oryza meyeriana var. granulata TaxID=110450 RepID=A0A6G1F048_9ORYZ|nr:hypothetical protein E2562_031934 [Oryza meyeriana var. granulata]
MQCQLRLQVTQMSQPDQKSREIDQGGACLAPGLPSTPLVPSQREMGGNISNTQLLQEARGN